MPWQMLHRLDVCTTGVLVRARSEAAARRFTADMTAHCIQKQYKVTLARGSCRGVRTASAGHVQAHAAHDHCFDKMSTSLSCHVSGGVS